MIANCNAVRQTSSNHKWHHSDGARPTKFPEPEEPNTIVQSPPRCHLRIKISTFVNLEGLFFLQKLPSIWTSSNGIPGVSRKFPFDLEIVSYQPNRATNDMSWPLLQTVPCKQWKQMFFKWVEKIVESCHANCIQVYIQTKNWYRWTNSCLHQLVGKSPEFFEITSISDPKNSQQYMSISIPNSVITSLKGNNNEPKKKRALL